MDRSFWLRREGHPGGCHESRSRYFYASFYKMREETEIMDEVTGLTKNHRGEFVRGPAREKREDFIFRPHRGWTGGQKKFVLVTEWYPRNPDIAAIIRSNKSTLYRDTLNRRLFPNGSVIAGFRRRRIGTSEAWWLQQDLGDSLGPLGLMEAAGPGNLTETKSTHG